MFFYGLVLNVEGLVATAVICGLLLFSRVSYRKTASICCFFLGGAAVAKVQWMIATGAGPSEFDWQLGSTLVVVGVTSLAGILIAGRFLRTERLLIIIVAMTALLAVLQFSGRPFELLNWYARIYALVCLSAPLVYVARAWGTPRQKGFCCRGGQKRLNSYSVAGFLRQIRKLRIHRPGGTIG